VNHLTMATQNGFLGSDSVALNFAPGPDRAATGVTTFAEPSVFFDIVTADTDADFVIAQPYAVEDVENVIFVDDQLASITPQYDSQLGATVTRHVSSPVIGHHPTPPLGGTHFVVSDGLSSAEQTLTVDLTSAVHHQPSQLIYSSNQDSLSQSPGVTNPDALVQYQPSRHSADTVFQTCPTCCGTGKILTSNPTQRQFAPTTDLTIVSNADEAAASIIFVRADDQMPDQLSVVNEACKLNQPKPSMTLNSPTRSDNSPNQIVRKSLTPDDSTRSQHVYSKSQSSSQDSMKMERPQPPPHSPRKAQASSLPPPSQRRRTSTASSQSVLHQPRLDDCDSEPLDEIWKKLNAEMSRFNLSQETFACVAMGKTQATLSEMLKRREKGLTESKATANTLRHCAKFLKLSEMERKRRYAQFNMGDKTSYLLSREYAGADFDGPKANVMKRKKPPGSLNAVSVGVLKEFLLNIGPEPDAAGLSALSDVLSLSKQTISAWFVRERERSNAK